MIHVWRKFSLKEWIYMSVNLVARVPGNCMFILYALATHESRLLRVRDSIVTPVSGDFVR